MLRYFAPSSCVRYEHSAVTSYFFIMYASLQNKLQFAKEWGQKGEPALAVLAFEKAAQALQREKEVGGLYATLLGPSLSAPQERKRGGIKLMQWTTPPSYVCTNLSKARVNG